MKHSKAILLYLLAVLISAVLISCSDNTSSPSGGIAKTVLFSKDTFGIWINPGNFLALTDSIGGQLSSQLGMYVTLEFTIQADADSIHSAAMYGVLTDPDTIQLPGGVLVFHPMDQYFTYSFNIPSEFHYTFLLHLLAQNNPSRVYIRFKNIKMTAG